MPMQIDVDDAASSVMRCITSGKTTGYFPTVFATILRGLSMLPMSLQIRLCRRLRAETSSSDADRRRALPS